MCQTAIVKSILLTCIIKIKKTQHNEKLANIGKTSKDK